jgi:hypothetical protein
VRPGYSRIPIVSSRRDGAVTHTVLPTNPVSVEVPTHLVALANEVIDSLLRSPAHLDPEAVARLVTGELCVS